MQIRTVPEIKEYTEDTETSNKEYAADTLKKLKFQKSPRQRYRGTLKIDMSKLYLISPLQTQRYCCLAGKLGKNESLLNKIVGLGNTNKLNYQYISVSPALSEMVFVLIGFKQQPEQVD